jgi:hypothetical protein
MSPTSYRAAPPRITNITPLGGWVNRASPPASVRSMPSPMGIDLVRRGFRGCFVLTTTGAAAGLETVVIVWAVVVVCSCRSFPRSHCGVSIWTRVVRLAGVPDSRSHSGAIRALRPMPTSMLLVVLVEVSVAPNCRVMECFSPSCCGATERVYSESRPLQRWYLSAAVCDSSHCDKCHLITLQKCAASFAEMGA